MGMHRHGKCCPDIQDWIIAGIAAAHIVSKGLYEDSVPLTLYQYARVNQQVRHHSLGITGFVQYYDIDVVRVPGNKTPVSCDADHGSIDHKVLDVSRVKQIEHITDNFAELLGGVRTPVRLWRGCH